MKKNKIFSKNQFFLALITYLFFIGIVTFLLIPFFRKIKNDNYQYKQKMNSYQNLSFVKKLSNGQNPIVCSGNLFFKANSPLISLHLFKNYLLASSLDQKIIAIDITNPQNVIFTEGLATSFYSDSSEILATDFLNNQIIKIIMSKNFLKKEVFQKKIGRPSTPIKDSQGNFFVSGYASGNIIRIKGSEKTIFSSDLDKIIGLGINSTFLYIARYNSTPSLLSFNLLTQEKTILESNKNFSDLISDGNNLLVAYQENNQTKIGKINNLSEEIITINCPFPLKIAINKDSIFYTSLSDFEGKIYFTKNNLHNIGK